MYNAFRIYRTRAWRPLPQVTLHAQTATSHESGASFVTCRRTTMSDVDELLHRMRCVNLAHADEQIEIALQSIMRDALPRGRFGLFDVLCAWGLLLAERAAVSFSPAFISALVDMFSPQDVDLWCMALEEGAQPVAGLDVYINKRNTCAMYLLGGTSVTLATDGGERYSVSFPERPDTQALRRVLVQHMHKEAVLRTLSVLYSHDPQPRYMLKWDDISIQQCPILQTRTFSVSTMWSFFRPLVDRSAHQETLLESEAIRVLSGSAAVAVKVLLHYLGARTEGAQWWLSNARDALQADSQAVSDAVIEHLRTFCSFLPIYRTPCIGVDSVVPILCAQMSREFRDRTKAALVPMLANRLIHVDMNRESIAQLKLAISACTPTTTKAAIA